MRTKFYTLILMALCVLFAATEGWSTQKDFSFNAGFYSTIPSSGKDTVKITTEKINSNGWGTFKVYDHGGKSGNYSANVNGTLVVQIPKGYRAVIEGSITTEKNYDKLIIKRKYKYGLTSTTSTSMTSTLLDSTSGSETIALNVAKNDLDVQYLIFGFTSDGSTQYAGIDLTVILKKSTALVNASGSIGYRVFMPVSGRDTLNITEDDISNGMATFKVFDDGGNNGNYSDSANGYLQVNVPSGYTIRVTGNIVTESGRDSLTIYGSSVSDIYLSQASGTRSIGPLNISGTKVNFHFQTSSNTVYSGLELTVALVKSVSSFIYDTGYGSFYVNMPRSGMHKISITEALIEKGMGYFKVYDDGGSDGYYSDVANGYLQVTAPSGYTLRVFGKIVTESGYDKLSVYGSSESSVYLDHVSGEQEIGVLNITGNTAIINFQTDGSSVQSGLELTVVAVKNVSLSSNGSGGYYVNMPRSGGAILNLSQSDLNQGRTRFYIYDNGGKDGYYRDSTQSYLQITVPSGKRLNFYVDNDNMSLYGQDSVIVFDGDIGVSKKIYQCRSYRCSSGEFSSTGSSATAYFYSDRSDNRSGFYLWVAIDYDITASVSPKTGGTLTSNKSIALPGETITMTAAPNSGYVLDSVLIYQGWYGFVYDYADVDVGWWTTGSRSFSFTMPNDTVHVIAYYSQISTGNKRHINMPTSGTKTINIPSGLSSFKIYDNGGNEAVYSNSVSGCLILTAPSGNVLNLSGTVNTEKNYDFFKAYDGNSTSSTLLTSVSGSPVDVGSIYSSGNVMTVCFNSNGSNTYDGLDLLVRVSKKTSSHTVTELSRANGTISVSPASATMGTTVSVTATPNTGYIFSGIKVLDQDDNVVTIVESNGMSNSVTFSMDFTNVSVEPYFASQSPTFDSDGCLTNGWYFRFKDGHLSQGALVPIGTEQTCWYKEIIHQVINAPPPPSGSPAPLQAPGDYVTYEGVWLELDAASSIILDTDLDFGGYQDGACVMNFKSLSPKTLNGNNKVIKNLCQTGTDVGFFTSANAAISNVTFEDAYLEGSSMAGVLAPTVSGNSTIQNVTIRDSYVEGEISGALIGQVAYATTLTNMAVSGSTVKGRIAGGMVGNVSSGYTLTLSRSGSNRNSVSGSTVTTYYAAGFTTGSAYAGGVVGSGSVTFKYPMPLLTDNTVSAASSIGSAWNVYLGGYVGYLTASGDVLKGGTASGMSVTNQSSAQNVSAGGYFGYVYGGLSIIHSGYNGIVSGGTAVGGLVGKFVKSFSSDIQKIFNTYTVGNISGSGNVGYIAGEWSVGTDDAVYNNYHYGSDLINAGIGNYSNWTEGSDNVHSNVRNATGTLQQSGPMGLYRYSDLCAETYHVDFFAAGGYDLTAAAPTDQIRNGIATEDDMKSDKFVALLNENRADSWSDSVWYRGSDNDGLPLPTSRVLFKNSPNAIFGSYITIELDGALTLADDESYGFYNYSVDFCNTEGNTGSASRAMVGWTSSDGRVSESFATTANEVKDNLGAYIVDGSGYVVDLTTASLVPGARLRMLEPTESYTVTYEYCPAQGVCDVFDNYDDMTFLFLSPKVTTIIGGMTNTALVPHVIALGDAGAVDELSIEIEYRDGAGATFNGAQFGAVDGMVTIADVEAGAAASADIKEIAIKYSANGSVPKIALNNYSGEVFHVSVYADNRDDPIPDGYDAHYGDYAQVEIPYGVSFSVHDFEDKIGYSYDSYSASLMVSTGGNCGEVGYTDYDDVLTENMNFAPWEDLNLSECSSKSWTLTGLKDDDAVGLGEVKMAIAKSQETDYQVSVSLSPKYNPIDYNVYFDLSSLTEEVVALGRSWIGAKGMNLGENASKFPKMYWKKGTNFGEVLWSGTQRSEEEFEGEEITWNEWLADNASTSLTPTIIMWATEGDASLREFTVYPLDVQGNQVSSYVDEFFVAAVDADDNTQILTNEADYHGNVVLSQSSGNLRFVQRSELKSDNDEDDVFFYHSLVVPANIDDTLGFQVSLEPDPGYEMEVVGSACDWGPDGDIRWCYFSGNGTNPDSLNVQPAYMNDMSMNVVYRPRSYEVNFGLEPVVDSLIVLGENWTDQKTMDVGPENSSFPNVYMIVGPYLFSVRWYASTEDPSQLQGQELTNWSTAHAFSSLTSSLIGDFVAKGLDENSLTLKPIMGDWIYNADSIMVAAYDYDQELPEGFGDEGSVLRNEDDYHGRVVLSQTSGDLTFEQKSKYSDVLERHYLMAPPFYSGNFDDVMTYNVSVDPDPGYAMTIEDYVFYWEGLDQAPPEGEGWGYTPESKTRGTLKYRGPKMSGGDKSLFKVKFQKLVYNLAFTDPSPAFVANRYEDDEYKMDWFSSLSNVTIDDMSAPALYNSYGCPMSWKVNVPEGSDEDTVQSFSIHDHIAFMVPVSGEGDGANVNTMVLDLGNLQEHCGEDSEEPFYTLRLHYEGEGSFRLVQKLGEGDDQIVVGHDFAYVGDDVYEMTVPKTMDNEGVTLTVEAIPAEGYVLKDITYSFTLNGNNVNAMVENGVSLNVMQDMEWNVKFSQYDPVYVTYDLSIDEEDFPNVWIPADAVTKGDLVIGADGSPAEMWTPYRTDKCFVGWSTKTAATYGANDPLYSEVSMSNESEFSKDVTKPTPLYAIWMDYDDNCEGPSVKSDIRLGYFEDESAETLNTMGLGDSLVVKQVFGSTVFTHKGVDFIEALAYNPQGYDIQVEVVLGAGHSPDPDALGTLAYVMRASDDIASLEAGDNGFRVGDVDSPVQYFFAQKEISLQYAFSYDTEEPGVLYGESWNHSVSEMLLGDSLAKNAFRADACLAGWNFTRGATEGFKTVNAEFIAAYDAAIASGAAGVKLYGVWDESASCLDTLQTISVTLVDDLKGKATVDLVQDVDGMQFVTTVGADGIMLPKAAPVAVSINDQTEYVGDYIYFKTLTVNPLPGYQLAGTDPTYTVGENAAVDVNASMSEWYMLENTVVSATVVPVAYDIAFDVNAGQADVFYPVGWTASATYDMSLDEDARVFPKAYRADKCLVGYGFDKDASRAQSFTVFDTLFIKAYDSLTVANGAAPATLYGVWNECSPAQTFYTVTLNDFGEGTLTLGHNGKSYAVPSNGFKVPAAPSGVKFALSFSPNAGYEIDAEGTFGTVDGETVTALENDTLVVDGDKVVDAPVKSLPNTFAFDVNAGDATVFYGSDWVESATYSLSGSDNEFPKGVYRVGMCLKGWALNATSTSSYLEFNDAFVSMVESASDVGLPVNKLYAIWGACETAQTIVTVANADTAAGTFTLSRQVSNTSMEYAVAGTALSVPADETLEFDVTYAANAGYAYDETAGISASDATGAPVELAGTTLAVAGDLTLSAAVTANTYAFALDENAGNAAVFYTGDAAATYSARMTDDESARTLPANLYRADACLAGWSLDASATAGFTLFDGTFVAAYDSIAEATGTAPSTLYAVWDTGCRQPLLTVTNADAGKGTLTLSQADGRSFEVRNLLQMPYVEGGIPFVASFTGATGYTYDASLGIEAFSATGASMGVLTDGVISIDQTVAMKPVSLVASTFEIAYEANAGDAPVFYGDAWRRGSDRTGFSLADAGAFPTDLYRTDSCLAGWTLSADGGTAYLNFDSAFVAAASASAEYAGKLYAKWGACAAQIVATVTQVSSAAGTMALTQADATGAELNRTSVGSAAVTLPLGRGDVTFSVSFVAGAGYTLDPDGYFRTVDSRGNDVTALVGDSVTLSGDTKLRAPVAADLHEIAFDANGGTSNVFYGPGWTSAGEYAMDMAAALRKFPTEAYRVGYTLQGWSTSATAGGEVYTSYDSVFAAAAKEISGTPITLYAVWGEATGQQTYSVTLVNPEAGSLTMKQVVGPEATFTINEEALEVPAVTGGLEFSVKATLNSGYFASGIELGLLNADGIRTGSLSNEILVVNGDKRIEIPVESDGVQIVFNENTDTHVFYEAGWNDRGFFAFDAETEFPRGVLRTDAHLLGWTLSRTSSKYYKFYDSTFVNDLRHYKEIGIPTDTLYAVWDTYGVFENVTLTSGSDRNGTFTISQTVNGKEMDTLVVTAAGVQVPYSEKGIPFNVKFETKPGYYLDSESPITGSDATGATMGSVANGGQLLVRSGRSATLVASVGANSYRFAYDVNGGGANVFYGDGWSGTGTKTLDDESVALPANIYRADACLEGWSTDAASDSGAPELTSEFVGTLGAHGVDTLYAVWKECDVETYTVSFANTNVGSLVLTQQVEDAQVSFEVSDTGLVVPVVEGGLKFKAAYTLKPGYSTDSDTLYVIDDISGLMKTLADNALTVNEDVTLAIPTEGKSFTLAFDVNRSGTVFLGPDWTSRDTYMLTDSVTSIPLPAYVYTSDRCMTGWSLDSAGKGATYLQFTSELAEALLSTKPVKGAYTMYAVWGRGDACDAAYDRISLSGEHGTVKLAEIPRGGDTVTAVHGFAKDGTMLLPKTTNGNSLRVVSVADSSYMLDYLVMTRDGTDERQVFYEGDALVFNLGGARFEAMFGKSNRTEVAFSDTALVQSGNAVRFKFTTSAFEPTRKVSVQVRLETEGGEPVASKTVSDSVAPSYSGNWDWYPLAAGRYVLSATIGDDRETAEYEASFEVASEIVPVAEEGWQMVSLGNLDRDAMDWDGDAKFFWWDESGASGEYWQYREYDPKDRPVATRGYWYSSLEGRPLVLKDTATKVAKKVEWKLENVNSGWNLVANPYGFALDLFGDQPAKKSEESGVTFWRWDATISDYAITTTAGPYEAVWVKVESNTGWTVPVAPDFDSVESEEDTPEVAGAAEKALRKSRRLVKADGRNEWRIQAVLSDAGGHMDAWNVLGAGGRPFATDEPPAGMGDRVGLSIVEGGRRLAKSVKAPADEQEWTLSLDASSARYGELAINGVDELNAFGLKVFVTVGSTTTEMHDGKTVRVALGTRATTATVRVAKSAKVVADLRIDGLRSVQSGRSLDVSFVASADLAGTRTVVEVLNMDGRVLSSRSATTLAGTNALALDAPRGGMYMLRVRAGSQVKAGRIIVR